MYIYIYICGVYVVVVVVRRLFLVLRVGVPLVSLVFMVFVILLLDVVLRFVCFILMFCSLRFLLCIVSVVVDCCL